LTKKEYRTKTGKSRFDLL